MEIKINKFNTARMEALPCYDEVQGQETTAYIYIEIEDKEVWVGCTQPHNTGLPPRQANGYVRTVRVPNNLTAKGYNDLLGHPNLVQLVEIVIEESHEYYNGSAYKMRLSDKGMDALEALDNLCAAIEHGDYESLEPVCAYWYLTDDSYEDLMRNGRTHEEVAQRVVTEAIKDGYFLTVLDVQNRLDEMKEATERGNNI